MKIINPLDCKESYVNQTIGEEIYDTYRAASYTGLSPATLAKYRQTKSTLDGPKYYRLGNHRVVYLIDDLKHWMDSRLNHILPNTTS